MKIVSLRVKNFRNIIDSGEIGLENLTCIVGKNQAGKTTILQALSAYNPSGSYKYNLSRDWPRKDRANKNPKAHVCEITFELTDEEITKLREISTNDFTEKKIKIASTYTNTLTLVDMQDAFPRKCSKEDSEAAAAIVLGSINANLRQKIPSITNVIDNSIPDLAALISNGEIEEIKKYKVKSLQQINTLVARIKNPDQKQSAAHAMQTYSNIYDKLINKTLSETSPHQTAIEYLKELIPNFVYMDQYREFQGQAIINQVLERVNNSSTTPSDETFLTILDLAGLDLENLVKQGAPSAGAETTQERIWDVRDAADRLTNRMKGHWSQNNFEVSFDLDGMNFITSIRETDRNIGLIPLEEESKGFKWFFSFDLRFMRESDRSFKDCVVLLDEPGIHLHPGAQESLLERLKVFAEKNVVLYTTHMPFMVDLKKPESIRVLESRPEGTTFSNKLVASCPHDKMTLQNALGMRCSQNYLVGQKNLIVEGYDDFILITALSNAIERIDGVGLHEDIVITPAGGASEVVYMATFMIGQGLSTVALFDSDEAGRREAEKLQTKWLLRYNDANAHTLMLGQACNTDEKDIAIEELFDKEYYIEHFKSSHKKKLNEGNIEFPTFQNNNTGMISKRLEACCKENSINFNKGSVAKSIQRDLNKIKSTDDFPTGPTLEMAKNLICAINDRLA